MIPINRLERKTPCAREGDAAASTDSLPQTDARRDSVPMKRYGTVEEIANAIVWLMSPEASYVTGANIDVAGGR